MISSANGFCASVSCSKVNCWKRGSLLITGVPINVAATNPPVGANATETNDPGYLRDAPGIENRAPGPAEARGSLHAQAAAGLKMKFLIGPKATPMRPAFSRLTI